MGRHVKNRILDNGALTVQIPDVTTDQRPAGIDGDIIFNKTTQTFQAYIGADWYNISTSNGEKTLTVDKFQGDGTTTVFGGGSGNTIDGSTAATLSVTPTDATDMAIFVGGVYQIPDTNYTYNAGTGQITFGSAPPANNGSDSGHIIAVIHNLHKLGA
jgi:hypothetical protein